MGASCSGNGGDKLVIHTASRVVGLAVDGKRLAWTDCHRIHVLDSGHDVPLRLPALVSSDACATEGKLVFAGNTLGWFFATSDRASHAIALGISSTTSRSSRLLRADKFYDERAYAGLHGGIAADKRTVLWTWPWLSLLGSLARYCDRYNPDDGCKVRVRDTAIHASSGRHNAVLHHMPPGGPIAASSGWIAVAVIKPGIYPQLRDSGPRLVVVARLRDGAVIARVRSRDPAEAVALSHHLLAIERSERIDLYKLPSGHWVRSVPLRAGTSYRFTGWMAVAGTSLIVWSADSVEVVDASGRRKLVVHTSGSHGLESDRVITAVATDGERVAWATTGLRAGSMIRVRALSQ